MEQAKLEEFNPWWLGKGLDQDQALPFKRDIYGRVERMLEKRFIIALVGLRRVGKTTMMYQCIDVLLKKKVPPTSILLFSFDDVSVTLPEVIETYKELQEKDFREERVYLFLDEIQKCKDWENELKRYYDLYPKLKCVISGSESLFIRKKTKETLAGRIFEFLLKPFDFKEYLDLQKIKKEDRKYETKIKPLFLRYIKYGGFPETFDLDSERERKEYVRALVVDKILFKDIPKLFNIDDPEFLLTLLELIATNPGLYLDYQALSQQFGKDRRVIKQYIAYLKESFLIRLLGNYRKGKAASLRKRKKAYPADVALIHLYKPQLDETFFGKIAETVVANHMNAALFWKNGGDVDFMQEDTPIEVKYQEELREEDFRSIIAFMKKFKQKKAVMITKQEEKIKKTEYGEIACIPLWKWLLKEKEE